MNDQNYSSDIGPKTKKEHTHTDHGYSLPADYGDNKIILMVRDPWTMFTYWEIKKEIEKSVRDEVERSGCRVVKSVLRVCEPDGEDRLTVMQFELRDWIKNWYIHVSETGRQWFVEIGFISDNGGFFLLARSNTVTTPANRMSDIFDEEWMCSEDLYYRMFAQSGGFNSQGSSAEIIEMVKRRLKEWRFPAGVSSGEMFGSASLFFGRKKNG